MNKTIILAALCVSAMTGCGKGSDKGASDSDSLPEAVSTLADSVIVRKSAYITKDSIGGISIGMETKSIPDSIAGLYNKKTDGASPDAVTLVFEDAGGERFITYDFGEGKVDVINLIGSDVKVKAPRGDFGIGDSFSKVLELPGVTTKWEGYDSAGMWYWIWEGLWFAPSQDQLPTVLSKRLYDSTHAPTVADFTEDVTVGFIGTGLPF